MSNLPEVVSVRLSGDMASKLHAKAQRDGCTASDVVRQAVARVLTEDPPPAGRCVCGHRWSWTLGSPAQTWQPTPESVSHVSHAKWTCGTCGGAVPAMWTVAQ